MTFYPLDPLSPVEIERAAEIARSKGGLSEAAWFETIALAEPDRNAPEAPGRRVLGHRPDGTGRVGGGALCAGR